ncbi:hypothetical protein E8E13_001491 [Curvularia kusanoi]|uniref:Uncharacterized protein n=1 Tax=Curvularia kusanoi TaxID=90978 RepID=A0A9P4T6Y7_CURKU|nr:hypothetical protein E8E13_001491 [Curvularia kusanoi]
MKFSLTLIVTLCAFAMAVPSENGAEGSEVESKCYDYGYAASSKGQCCSNKWKQYNG